MSMTLGNLRLDSGKRSYVMGVLNITPDSFWDGGRHADVRAAVDHAGRMVDEGADIIDVGGESTRPGSLPVDEAEEIGRLRPVVEELVRRQGIPVSIDTRKAAVARAMLDLGAHMINDVSGFGFDDEMPDVVVRYGVPVVLMHMRGTPETMQDLTDYGDVVSDVREELGKRIGLAEERGVDPDRIIVDPGIGFSKTAEQSLELIARLGELRPLGKTILLGPSRKSFMGKIFGLRPEERLEATIAACVVGALKGASILRVHDVGPVARALRVLDEAKRYSRCEDVKVPE
jgi:dihydropteroate synthase